MKWLRESWKQQTGFRLDPSVFTIHSCKATVLSWSAQHAHLLTEESRLQQGHHRIGSKGSLRLYSRESGNAGKKNRLYSRRCPPCVTPSGYHSRSILTGWRPTVPQHRGIQSPLVEPTVGVIEQYSNNGTMSFKWFLFGSTPEPTISSPQRQTDLQEEAESSSSSNSSSSSSSSDREKKPSTKKTARTAATYLQLACGVTHFGVGHAMIPDDSAQDSSLMWQDLPWKTACGRRLSKTTCQKQTIL